MTPVVFVHGFMGGSQQWREQLKVLAPRPVIAIDLPGYGTRTNEPAFRNIAQIADWVLDQLDGQNVDKFDLIGHSMGGMIAQEMIARAPNRIQKLILYGTGAKGVLPGRFETIETSKSRALADGPKATAQRIAATWFLDGDAAPGYKICAEIAQKCRAKAIQAGLDAMNDWQGEALLDQISSQTLVIWGDADRTYSWAQTEQLWQRIKGARLAVLPNCAHAAHLEKPSLFNGVLKDFLAE